MNADYSQAAEKFTGVTPDSAVHPEEKEKKHMATGKALSDCAHFTGGATSLLHPDYSFTIQGLKMVFWSKGGDYNFEPAIGMLMLMASPVEESFRLGAGGVGMIGGAIATAVTGFIYSAEWVGRAALGVASAPSNPAKKRKKLMQAFVKRMNDTLNEAYKKNVSHFHNGNSLEKTPAS